MFITYAEYDDGQGDDGHGPKGDSTSRKTGIRMLEDVPHFASKGFLKVC